MIETELKFQVPAESRISIKREFAVKSARTLELRAWYFDTPDRRLARAGLALRLRKEGRQWVQTLKGPGSSALHRLEHEVALGELRAEPAIDVARHAGTPAAAAIAAALNGSVEPLQVSLETDVLRTLRDVRSARTLVEVAFDQGEVIAGGRRLPLCEVEFELKRGSVDALLALAASWVDRHRLWLDVRSKAERGDRLARGIECGPVVTAKEPLLTPNMGGDAALRAIVGVCLAQVLPNAAEVAAGTGETEHLHQLRVGLRRLRSAFGVFGDLSAATDPAWAPALAALFAQLGSTRDRDVLAESVLPELRGAGAPLAELPPDTATSEPGAALRGVAGTKLLLELIGFAQAARSSDPGPSAKPRGSIVAIVRRRLRHMEGQLKRDAAAFETLDDTRRHRTRKRLKRYRYSIEFFASLFAPKGIKRCLKRVRPAQELLGRFNDLAVAEQAFRALADHDARAWFAAGWLAARRAELVPRAKKALVKLAESPVSLHAAKHSRSAR